MPIFTSNPAVAYNEDMKWNKEAIFDALGDATRRRILDELSERDEQTLYELTARLVMKHRLAISRQAIAKHLSRLEAAGLVKWVKRGKFRVIKFDREPLQHLLDEWLK